MSLARRAAYWSAAPAVCLLIWWRSLQTWFRGDDFAWLTLATQVHNLPGLLSALFHPFAQGTIRPWSERAFFILGYALFGLDPLPFHLLVFATQIANLALVTAIGARLAGSRAAGLCAACLWAVHSAALEPLGWISGYNQVLCAFFLLLAFYFLLRLVETGERRFELAMWAAFLIGFGAQELNLVFPALAAAYTFLCARPYFRRTLPLFAASAAYILIHVLAVPVPNSGDYALHFTGGMLRTLVRYWTWSAGPSQLWTPWALPQWMVLTAVGLITLGLGAFAWSERRGAVWFCAAWYLVTIAPVLPLRDHRMQYYVFIPLIGACWLGGWALAVSSRKPVAIALAALFVLLVLPRSLASIEWNARLTGRVRNLVLGVASAHRQHPTQSILLYGVDDEQFRNVILERPFRLLGFDRVYLAPGTEQRIPWQPDGDPNEFVLPAAAADPALAGGELVVYDVTGPQLRNITTAYAAMPRQALMPSRIDAADPHAAALLGPEWYPAEGSHRWMAKRATIRIAGPARPGQHLILRGVGAAVLQVTVRVDGIALPQRFASSPAGFEVSLPLPDSAVGKPEIEVALEVDHTVRVGEDPRELGLAFGVVEIR